MSTVTQVEINGKGEFIDALGELFYPMEHPPLTVGELFKRSEKARMYSARLIKAAENMEKLAKEHLDYKD